MLKLKRFDKPQWFDVPQFEGVRLLIKPASFKTTTQILSTVKRKIKTEDGYIDDFDDGKFALELFKELLVDFEGIEVDGDPSKDEVKELLYEYEFFRTFVSEKANELYKTIEQELDEELKNSTSSQGG